MNDSAFEKLRRSIEDRATVVGIIGLGYVGLPLSVAIARSGFRVIGFDIDPSKPILVDRFARNHCDYHVLRLLLQRPIQ